MPITISINLIISIIVSIVFLPVIINLLTFKKKKNNKNEIKEKSKSVHWNITKYVLPFFITRKRAIMTVI
jgi:multidrug efflux pump subunit AcrB